VTKALAPSEWPHLGDVEFQAFIAPFPPQIRAALVLARYAVTNKPDHMPEDWAWLGETLVLLSPSGNWYQVTGRGCDCQAGKLGRMCWHQSSRRILIWAREARRDQDGHYAGFEPSEA
jgi:hypothetical protein